MSSVKSRFAAFKRLLKERCAVKKTAPAPHNKARTEPAKQQAKSSTKPETEPAKKQVKSRLATFTQCLRKKCSAKKTKSTSNTKPDTKPAKKLGFLDLPPEIRNKIYAHAIPHNQLVTIYGATPGLTQTCRRVRAETRAMFYAHNTFVICTRHRRHKLAVEEWFTVMYPTVGTLLSEMLIISCNIKMNLRRIPGTDKWAASLDAGNIHVGNNRPLTHAEKAFVVSRVYGMEWQPRPAGDRPYAHDLRSISGLINNTRRYDEYADRRKLEQFVPRHSTARYTTRNTTRRRREYLLAVAAIPLLPIVLATFGFESLKETAERVAWRLKEPSKNVCKPPPR